VDDVVSADYRRLHESVFRFVRKRSNSREDAEDITQDVFAQAIAAFGRGRDSRQPPLSWLYMVAERRMIDAVRRRRVPTLSLDVDGLPHPNASNEYDPELVTILLRSVNSLDQHYRQVVVLKLLEGRSFRDIAVTTGVSESACKMRFARALARLRDELTRQGISR
jgi:RNA polymerase sigma-70 factor (ECF subfamily)